MESSWKDDPGPGGAAASRSQGEIEQDEVELVAPGELECTGGRAGHRGVEPFAPQGMGERLGDRDLVLDEQDLGAGSGSHGASDCSAGRACHRRPPARLCRSFPLGWPGVGRPRGTLPGRFPIWE